MNTVFSKTIVPGGKWSGRIGKGKQIRFTAMEAGANLSMMMVHAHDLSERYNMPDTLKAQHTFHLTKGNVLMSDNGRVLASITNDSLGWHDTVSGYSTRAETDEKYGKTSYQERRNEWLRSGEENFAVELFRNGLHLRDLASVVNWFSKVKVDDKGNLSYCFDHCKKGDSVTLRTEMDVLLFLSNTPNRLDPRTKYPAVPVLMEVEKAAPVDVVNDYCVNYRPENRRAFENTWNYDALK